MIYSFFIKLIVNIIFVYITFQNITGFVLSTNPCVLIPKFFNTADMCCPALPAPLIIILLFFNVVNN